MSDKMEMSLDDIINLSKIHQVGGNNRDGRTSPGSPRKGGALRSSVTRMLASRCGSGSGVRRDRNRGGINRNRSFGGLHRISDRKREAFFGPSTGENFGGEETTKVIVSNLDYGVTDCDILELFSEFGPLKRAGVNYDRFDRSLGSADVIFERRSDAIKALRQCNGLPLDGREIDIQLASSKMSGINPARTADFSRHFSSRPRINRPGAKRSTNCGGRRAADIGSAGNGKKSVEGKAGGDKTAGGKMAQKKVLTAEDLDAELDEYLKSMV